MKSVRNHVVNFSVSWLSRRERAKTYSHKIAVYGIALQSLATRVITGFQADFPSSQRLRRHPESHAELSPAKQGQKAV